MKKKFTKITAVLMCIIIACMSMSVSVFAANKDVYTIDQFDGYDVWYYGTNESETRAFFELNYGEKYATTTNGRDYTFFDFQKFIPKGCDEIELYDCCVKGDLFCLLLIAYKYEWVTDGYDEWETAVPKEQMILTTTDFKSFNKYSVDKSIDSEEVVKLHTIGDTFFYSTVEHRTSGNKTYFSGVYYTTKDFKNWTKHNTPESEAKDEFQYASFFVAGDVLCIEVYETDQVNFVSEKVYATKDFENYTTIFNGYDKGETSSLFFLKGSGKDKVVFVEDVYSKNNDDYLRTEVFEVDIKTGKKQVILNEKLSFWEFSRNENNLCFMYERREGDFAEVLMYNERSMKFETEKTDYNIFDVYFDGYFGDALLFYKGDSLCVAPSGNPAHYTEYDLSYLGISDATVITIRLNGEFFALVTELDDYEEFAHTKVAKLNISLQKNGDLNNDGVVNSTDALAVLMSTVNKKTLTAAEKAVADTTKDGAINSTDALMILQYAVGKRLGI